MLIRIKSCTLLMHNFKSKSVRCISSKYSFKEKTFSHTIHDQVKNSNLLKTVAIAGSLVSSFLFYHFYENNKNTAKLKDLSSNEKYGKFNPNLPSYSLDEVSKHSSAENKIWVTFRQGVYDITNFVSEHPGGEQIMIAAGSSVEPFWLLYAVHNNPHILELLETMRIGNVSLEESKQIMQNLSDPYSNDPKRHAVLKPASLKPYNAEPPPNLLVGNFITPNELFYVRNHLPVPNIDIASYELEIEIEGKSKSIILNYDDLKKFPKHTVTATVMCAGNRRNEMTKVKTVKGLDWGPAAVGNATWTGAKLRDILKSIGIDETSDQFNHIQFEGLDIDSTGKSYGASIPFWKGIENRGDVILAYEMNEVPIPRDHGFPVRVIVPGVVGARNVKWLGKIIVSKNESDSHWQQNDYKGFSPSTDWDTVDFSKSPAIQELPVISAICKPSPEETVVVKNDTIQVQGYAWSGGGQQIVRIDVTVDGGHTWHVANLDHQDNAKPPQHWAWTLWTVQIPIPKKLKRVEIWAKAVDSSYNTQPESFKNIWNLRGVLSNAYHRVPVNLTYL